MTIGLYYHLISIHTSGAARESTLADIRKNELWRNHRWVIWIIIDIVKATA